MTKDKKCATLPAYIKENFAVKHMDTNFVPLNLKNKEDLMDFLVSFAFGYGEGHGFNKVKDRDLKKIIHERFSPEKLRDKKFVQQEKNLILQIMVALWFKKRIPEYLEFCINCNTTNPKTEKEKEIMASAKGAKESLLLVKKATLTDKDWLKKALKEGKKIYFFDKDKISENFQEELKNLCHFLYLSANDCLQHQQNIENSGKGKFTPRLDALTLDENFSNYEVLKKKAKLWKLYQKSVSGTVLEMKLSNGLSVYKLTTKEALDYEGEQMGSCIGKGEYDIDVETGLSDVYSIRDEKGESHVTFEIRNNSVFECKGKKNIRPVEKYIPSVQEFVKAKNFSIRKDIGNVGLIKQNGIYYSIYQLPDRFNIENPQIEFSDMDLFGINLNLVVENLIVKNCTFSNPVNLDLTNMKLAYFKNCDLSKAQKILWPTEKVDFSGSRNTAEKFPEKLDFSNTKEATFKDIVLRNVKTIKWPKENIVLWNVGNLNSILDFSEQQDVKLSWLDLKNVTELKAPKGCFDFSMSKNLPKRLDFSKATEIKIIGCDFRGVEQIRWPEKLIEIQGIESVLMTGDSKLKKSYDQWQKTLCQQKGKKELTPFFKSFLFRER